MRRSWLGLLLVLAALTLTGCSAFVDPAQGTIEPGHVTVLEAGHPVGQTFVAHHAGLNGVEVWLEPGSGSQGELRFHLLVDPHVEQAAATATLPLAQVTSPGFYRFSFPSLPDSHGRYCYAFLELVGEGQVRVGAGPGESYLDGALYRDHQPLDAQMAFRLVYDPVWIGVDLGGAVLGWGGLLAVAGLLYVVPGWALLAWLLPRGRLSWAELVGLAVGVSLALYPLLLLWTDLVGLHLGPLYAWLPVLGGLAALAWRYRDWRPHVYDLAGRQGWETLRQWARSEHLWPDLTLLAVLALVFGVRFLVVRTLDAPMWGDSYQHTMIAQLLVDHGGLFDSWEPYAPLQTFTYHFGFHSAVAIWRWLTGTAMMPATIWVGQLLNGLAVLTLYPLAVRVSGNRWAGVVAVLVAGLLAPMPMYYTNWGRYTQLTGQVILPSAACLALTALESQPLCMRKIVLAWIGLGGLAVTHYLVSILTALFFVAFFVLRVEEQQRRTALVNGLWLAGGVGVLSLPWFIHTLSGKIFNLFAHFITTPASATSAWTRQTNVIGDPFFYLPVLLWLLIPLSIGWGLWRREKRVALVSLWWFLALLTANPQWLNLPGEGILDNHALFMAAYIPAGLLIGAASGWLARLSNRRLVCFTFLLLVLGIGLWGAWQRLGDLRVAQHALVTRPDIRAATWIQEHTAPDARFLVNSFFAYGGTVVAGSDGGWWLQLLARRQTSLPPFTYGFEQGPVPDYREWVNALTAEIQQKGIEHPDVLATLRERGITHVYIGQRQGRVNYDGPHVLDPNRLLAIPHFRPIYHLDRVWIFEVLP